MDIDRRRFLALGGAGAGLALSGSLAGLLPANPAPGHGRRPGTRPGHGHSRPVGYGELVPDRAGLLDLPRGFRYEVFSREVVDRLDDGSPMPSGHDGMGAFAGRHGALRVSAGCDGGE